MKLPSTKPKREHYSMGQDMKFYQDLCAWQEGEIQRLLGAYESAVQGRREFRAAYAEARKQRALPKITREVIEKVGMSIPIIEGTGREGEWKWTKEAIAFACFLQDVRGTSCPLCASGMNSFVDPETGDTIHARNGEVTRCLSPGVKS